MWTLVWIERGIIMALLEVQKAGSPVLKKLCEPIKKLDGKLRNFLDDMAEHSASRICGGNLVAALKIT